MDRESQLDALTNYIASLNNGSYSKPLTLEGVDVTGTGALLSKPNLLKSHIQPLLDASSVAEVVTACDTVQRALGGLGIYKDVILGVNATTPGRLLANIELPTAKRFIAQTGTNFGNSEGSGFIKGTVKNFLGFGECVSLDTSVGTRTKTSSLFRASLPLANFGPRGLFWTGEFLAYGSQKDIDWANHREKIRGLSLRVNNGDNNGAGVDCVVRSMLGGMKAAPTPNTSFDHASVDSCAIPSRTVRDFCGFSYKLSFFANAAKDTRDSKTFPTQGGLVRANGELAVGDYPHIKALVHFQRAAAVSKYATLVVAGKIGAMSSLSAHRTTHVMDRFKLGGPLDLRGFRISHVGPHDGADAIGGNAIIATGLSLFANLPRTDMLKLHLFFNTGNVVPQLTKGLISNISSSSGLGLVLNHPSARFELNFTLPISAKVGEQVHKGLQFGLGFEFL